MTTVMIMAGGTGGHVYPAMSVAQALRDKRVNVVWLGTRGGLEARVVPQSGFEIEWLGVRSVVGASWRRKLTSPWMLLRALGQALRILRRRAPDVVLGMGGFVAGPGGVAAWLLRYPLVIHEANARAGRTNRLLAPLARRVLTGFARTDKFPSTAHWTGNPVRAEIATIPDPAARALGENERLRVLVLGGSQGARSINEIVPLALSQSTCRDQLDVTHQSGAGHDSTLSGVYGDLAMRATVVPFIDDMAAAYRTADLVIARSGAMTVAELCAAGVPAILLPYPYAADDHQFANASFAAEAGAALVIRSSELNIEVLKREVERLFANRRALRDMAGAARRLAEPDATQEVVRICLESADA